MQHSHKRRIFGFVLAMMFSVPFLSAVIDVERHYHGKTVHCLYSGLIGVARSCGIDGYERVFTGTVRSSADVGDTDKLLEIEPDEVFLGDSKRVTAVTNQACLDTEIKTGDKWLFYVYRDPNSNALVVPYDGRSKPVTDAENDLSMLRDLVRFTDSGMLVGKIDHLTGAKDGRSTPLANHKVLATSDKEGTQHITSTDAHGYFQFALPPATYAVTVAPEYGLQELDGPLYSMLAGSIPLEKGQCWEHDFSVKRTANRTDTNSNLSPRLR